MTINTTPGYYHALKDYLRSRYGARVQKITLDAGFTCPNREDGREGCLFCDPYGSGSGLHRRGYPLEEQIRMGIEHGRKRYKARYFWAYFQAFSNTYADTAYLKKQYDIIQNFPEITGLAVGTRPDCLNRQSLDLLASYTGRYEVWLELGVQTSSNDALHYIRRGHTWEDTLQAMKLVREYPLNICLHFVFGLPRDTVSNVIQAVKALAEYGFQGIKMHNLYITIDSPIYGLYQAGKLQVPDYSQYLQAVCDTLEILPQTVIIQRLIGEASPQRLVAPEWSSQKTRFLADVKNELIRRNSYQGKETEENK